MGTFKIKKGRDIHLKGAADKQIEDLSFPKFAAVQPPNFRGLRCRLEVKAGDQVKVGSTVLSDKNNPDIKIASPASGRVAAVNRGLKRALLSVVIETDGEQEAVHFDKFSEQQIIKMSRQDAVDTMLKGHLWPILRQRPFSKVANPDDKPKSIFVHAMNTEPLAPDIDFVLQAREKEFQAGLDVLTKLTEGSVHVCAAQGAQSKAITQAQRVQTHYFSGPHPTGNVSTHIHRVDPINKGDIVWYVEAQDVLQIAQLFLNGVYPTERVVAVTGEGASGHQMYARTIVGTPVADFMGEDADESLRIISGSVLSGKDVGKEGFLCFYDSQVTAIPAGGTRELLGWLVPGFKKYTFSKTYASAFLSQSEVSLDSDKHGSDRTIVLNDIYDSLVPLDIMTYFLIRAVVSENIDEAEQLGILECDEEDFALCTFACPSKTEVGAIIRQGLDMIERDE